MNEQLKKLITTAGAHIHTANKCYFYYDKWENKELKLEPAIDAALAGDWKSLQELLKYLW